MNEVAVNDGTLALIGCDLTELPFNLAQEFGKDVKILDLSSNRIRSGTNLKHLPELSDVILDKNGIESLSALNLPVMKSVTTLWLNNNALQSLSEVVDEIAAKFPNVSYLSMLRNPACPDMYFSEHNGEADAYQRYRYFVIWSLPLLTHLDAMAVSTDERKEAVVKGPSMRPAAPDPSQYNQATASPPKDDDAPVWKASNHRPAAFLARGKMRYDGTHSEGNRFICNDDL